MMKLMIIRMVHKNIVNRNHDYNDKSRKQFVEEARV